MVEKQWIEINVYESHLYSLVIVHPLISQSKFLFDII